MTVKLQSFKCVDGLYGFIYLFITFYYEYLCGESIHQGWYSGISFLYDIEMRIKFCVFLEFSCFLVSFGQCGYLSAIDRYFLPGTQAESGHQASKRVITTLGIANP